MPQEVDRTPEEEELRYPSRPMSSTDPKTAKKNNKDKRRQRELKEHNADDLQAEPTTVKRTRINWSTEWDNGRPDLNNQAISMKKDAASKGIPYAPFHSHARADKENRNPLGAHVGRRAFLNDRQSDEVVCQAAIRADRANMGLTPMQYSYRFGR